MTWHHTGCVSEAPDVAVIDSLAIEKTSASHVRHLCGVREILAHEALLQDFAAACGQHFAMHGLQFKLEHEYHRRKTAHLFAVVAGENTSARLTCRSLLGCVLFFEYRLAGCNTGFFATGDSTGIGTVIAPPSIRAHIAAIASSETLRHGHMVLTCFRDELESAGPVTLEFPRDQKGFWSAQVREVRDRLRLCPTYDATLETMGKRTRAHLRYYRKRLQAETGCVFVADAAYHIADPRIALLNSTFLGPVGQRIFDMQFRATAQLPGGYVHGLRTPDGQWLSLAGGWRQGPISMVLWQSNSGGVRRHSVSTASRAFLVEHEVSLGTRQLYFSGGTTDSIHHAFQKDRAVDLLLRRPGPLLSNFSRLVSHFAERDTTLANRGNLLVDALRNRNLTWLPLSESAAASEV